ncbi:MAG: hypothetical protein U0326_01725 [Polyangiales bacterium]
MTDEGPKLNGPDRYRKRSPRLVLEEHSHCEVPAGCGGVVLRWINADREITVQIRLYATVEGATLTIDGAAPSSSRMLLARGDHVLAIHARGGAVMCSVRFEEKGYDRRVSRATGLTFACDSADDGTWRATAEPPDGSRWRDDPFDDASWAVARAVTIAAPPERDAAAWHHRNLTNDGVIAIGIPDHDGAFWLRKRFRIPLVGEPGGGA